MPFREAGERFVSYLSNRLDKKIFTITQQRPYAFGVSYQVNPSLVMDYQWEHAHRDIYDCAYDARDHINKERNLPPDKAVLVNVLGSPVTREEASEWMRDLRTGMKWSSCRLNPITVTFSIPYEIRRI